MKTLAQINKKLLLALAVSAAASQASALRMQLDSAHTYNNANGFVTYFDTSASTAKWSFDGMVLSSAGTYIASQSLNSSLIYTNIIENLSVNLWRHGAASATHFECVEGVFGGYVGANMCGNYELGANYIDESSLEYNVGGNAGNQILSLGGDDISTGDAQQLSWYDMNGWGDYYSWDGSVLQVTFLPEGEDRSTHMTFSVSSVPVPAAAWLFGSAVLGLASLKRRQTKK